MIILHINKVAFCRKDKLVKCHFVFVKLLSALHFLSHKIYINNANVVLTVVQLLLFLQNEGKCIKEVKIITSMGMLRAAAK